MKRRRYTVAIVEDEPSMRRSIERLLHAAGFPVETFASAEAFLARAGEGAVGCAVVDIHLGGASGLELRRHLAAAALPVPVIFITADDDETLEAAARDLGCVDYLRKPFPSEALIAAVTTALSPR